MYLSAGSRFSLLSITWSAGGFIGPILNGYEPQNGKIQKASRKDAKAQRKSNRSLRGFASLRGAYCSFEILDGYEPQNGKVQKASRKDAKVQRKSNRSLRGFASLREAYYSFE